MGSGGGLLEGRAVGALAAVDAEVNPLADVEGLAQRLERDLRARGLAVCRLVARLANEVQLVEHDVRHHGAEGVLAE